MTEQEAFARLDEWCFEASVLVQGSEESVVQDLRDPQTLFEMAAALRVDPTMMMKWVLQRLATEKRSTG